MSKFTYLALIAILAIVGNVARVGATGVKFCGIMAVQTEFSYVDVVMPLAEDCPDCSSPPEMQKIENPTIDDFNNLVGPFPIKLPKRPWDKNIEKIRTIDIDGTIKWWQQFPGVDNPFHVIGDLKLLIGLDRNTGMRYVAIEGTPVVGSSVEALYPRIGVQLRLFRKINFAGELIDFYTEGADLDFGEGPICETNQTHWEVISSNPLWYLSGISILPTNDAGCPRQVLSCSDN